MNKARSQVSLTKNQLKQMLPRRFDGSTRWSDAEEELCLSLRIEKLISEEEEEEMEPGVLLFRGIHRRMGAGKDGLRFQVRDVAVRGVIFVKSLKIWIEETAFPGTAETVPAKFEGKMNARIDTIHAISSAPGTGHQCRLWLFATKEKR